MDIRLKSKEEEELVSKNLRLVHYLVNRMGPIPVDYEDAVSVGTMGLIKAASTFDSSKGIKFATYASLCINNEIFMYFRKEKRYADMVSIEDVISVDIEDNGLTFQEILADPDSDFTERILQRDFVERLINIILNLLTPRNRLIMLYTIAGIRQEVIGESLNVSQSYISRLQKSIQKELKLYINNSQKYKGVFEMSIQENSYQITFSSKNVSNFNNIFASFLQNLTSAATLPDFKVVCDKERIIIRVPAHPESFSFIARIIKEIDNYTFVFESNKEDNIIKVNNQDIEVAEEPNVVSNDSIETVTTEPEIVDENEIISDNLSTSIEADKKALTDTDITEKRGANTKKVRDYMLSNETFTFKELKSRFPYIKSVTIGSAVHDAKNKGLITSTGRGKYAVVKK